MTILLIFFVIVALILIAVLAIWGIGIYNGLVVARNGFRNAFAQIDVQMQRRFDLIPNLVETVKGYMTHEKEVLESVIKARSAAQTGLTAAKADPGDPAAMALLEAAEAKLNSGIGRLLAIAEAYPDLKANQNMMQLTEELSSTENRVAFARQAFNDAVTGYNNKRETFPSSVLAGMFNFQPAALLDIPVEQQAEVRAAPKISF